MAATDHHGVTAAIQSEQPSLDEKYPIDEKNDKSSSDGDVDVVVVEEDEIRESGMFSMIKSYFYFRRTSRFVW